MGTLLNMRKENPATGHRMKDNKCNAQGPKTSTLHQGTNSGGSYPSSNDENVTNMSWTCNVTKLQPVEHQGDREAIKRWDEKYGENPSFDAGMN